MNTVKIALLLSTLTFCTTDTIAQQAEPAMCRASEEINTYYNQHIEAAAEQQANELFTQQHIQSLQLSKSSSVDTYRIAVVFHVYGTNQGGNTVNNTVIETAIKRLNDDFHGLNSDYNQVHSQFMPVRSKKNIKFYLAKKDPNGNPTTGVLYYPTTYGYGNGSGYDAQIAADAWDNYKYINVYVQHDLYNDGTTNNSGVAWYPNTGMSNNNTARIVYNGAYLATNTSPEFSSVLTHEFGHFFNLIHTFDGGCTMPNDNVTDTPPCTTAQGCHSTTTTNLPLNCNGQLVNSDNYMDYNICYKMFTTGQTNRMDAALQFPSRVTLWQDSTVLSTGIYTPANVTELEQKRNFKLFPNPSTGQINIESELADLSSVEISVNDVTGRAIATRQSNTGSKIQLDLSTQAKGIYFIRIKNGSRSEILKVDLL